MIYYNLNTINDWNFGDDNIIKVYKHGAVCYYKITSGDTPTPVQEPCFAVVDDITQYSDTEFEDVYDKATEKWFKLNNLNQYEEYGIYGSGRTLCGAVSFTELTDIIAQSTTAITNHNITVTPAVGAFSKIRIDTTKSATTGSYCWTTFTPTPSGSEVLGINMNSIGTMNGYGNNKNYVTDANGSQTFAHWVDDNNTIVEIDIAALSNNQASELYLLFYQENCKPAAFSFYIESTDCVTTYNGKLTIDDGYEYEWNGSSWVNIGEVSGSSRVPVGYTEVEYVQNSGTSYFNTNFVPNQDTRVVCDMQLVTASNYPRLWGAGAWNSANGLMIDYEGGHLNMSWLGKTSWTSYTSVPQSFDRKVYDVNKNYLYVDSVQIGSNTYTTRTASDPIGVFTYIGSGRPSSSSYWGQEHFKGKMYSFKVYDNGTLVRDLVPCKRDNDNTVGAYDIVNDVFYTVPTGYTTDKLIAGAETGSTEYPKYYDEIQDPPDNLVFSSMAEAEAYECPWVGMHATIDGDNYVFSGDSQSGYEWVYNPSRLPQGYTEVEYITSENISTGVSGPYIDTNFTPNQNTRVVMDYQPIINGQQFRRIFGSGEYNTLGYVYNMEGSVGQSNCYYYYKFGNTSSWYTTTIHPDLNRHTVDFNNNGQILLDNTSIATLPNNTFTCTYHLGLFRSISNQYTTNNICFLGRVYSCQVYDNGTLVRDFVPCINPSNSVGMYDIVNDVFYTTANASYQFTAGNPV